MSAPNPPATEMLEQCAESCRRNIACDLVRCLQALYPQKSHHARATCPQNSNNACHGQK